MNVFHAMYTINELLPLIRKGSLKKIVYITSGVSDLNFVRAGEFSALLGYSTSKAIGNMVMTKYGIELRADGISTLSLSPGWVKTDGGKSSELATSDDVMPISRITKADVLL